ncbi:MAG TPA: hypothetical protein VFS20_14560 [Longimicrobium sp.]|nr:hypothetical protein [Longimicrobium sp.]
MNEATLLLLCALALPACARGTPAPANVRDDAPSTAPTAADWLRGTVDIVGSEPGTWVVLRLGGGRRDVTLLGDTRLLRRLAGLEVAVWGASESPGVFRVTRVEVRAADGIAAVDGVLARQGAGWVLVTHDGRRLPVARLPQALRGMEGARVWLAGPLDRDPDSSGVISDPPR